MVVKSRRMLRIVRSSPGGQGDPGTALPHLCGMPAQPEHHCNPNSVRCRWACAQVRVCVSVRAPTTLPLSPPCPAPPLPSPHLRGAISMTRRVTPAASVLCVISAESGHRMRQPRGGGATVWRHGSCSLCGGAVGGAQGTGCAAVVGIPSSFSCTPAPSRARELSPKLRTCTSVTLRATPGRQMRGWRRPWWWHTGAAAGRRLRGGVPWAQGRCWGGPGPRCWSAAGRSNCATVCWQGRAPVQPLSRWTGEQLRSWVATRGH